jgi:hypothetical protein
MARRSARWPLAAALLLIPIVALALLPLRDHVRNADIALIMVVAVVAIALTASRPATIVAALGAAFWFDLLFTEPIGRVTITKGEDLLTAFLLLAVGLVVGELSIWAVRQRDRATRTRDDLRRVQIVAGRVAHGEAGDPLAASVGDELCVLLDLEGYRFDRGPADPQLAHIERDGSIHWGDLVWGSETLGLPSRGVALEVTGHGRPIGAFTLLPRPGRAVTPEDLAVAVALADQVGAAFAASEPG